MSDSYISLVPNNVEEECAKALANRSYLWLVKNGIIQPQASDCTLGEFGYEPGPNYLYAIGEDLYGLKNLKTNGLEIVTERTIFHNGGNGLEEINCPKCGANCLSLEWSEAIDDWLSGESQGSLICGSCSSSNSIIEYRFQPLWCFGFLGFSFWNWPAFTEEFIKDLEELLNRRVQMVFGRI